MKLDVFTCRRCGGILLAGVPPTGTVTLTVEGYRYHFYCGYKEEARIAEEQTKLRKEAQRAEND